MNISVQGAAGDVNLTFAMVTAPGTTTFGRIDPTLTGLPAPNGYTIVNQSNAYDIVSNAAYSGPITVCMTAPSTIGQSDFERLRILHGENGALVDRTILAPDTPAPNFFTSTVCARVDSLSPFVLALAPQSGFTITGRVLTPGGQGLRNTTVTLTDSQGFRRVATTSSFGVYTFENLPPGQNYILGVTSRRFRFAPKAFDLTANIADADFVGLE